MPDEISSMLRRLDMTERNQTDLAKSVTALVVDVADLKTKDAVNAEREKARDDWRTRTEEKLNSIYKLGWWVLFTFGTVALGSVARFLFSGGFNVPQ